MFVCSFIHKKFTWVIEAAESSLEQDRKQITARSKRLLTWGQNWSTDTTIMPLHFDIDELLNLRN